MCSRLGRRYSGTVCGLGRARDGAALGRWAWQRFCRNVGRREGAGRSGCSLVVCGGRKILT